MAGPTQIGIFGAGGRMGQAVISLIAGRADLEIAATIGRRGGAGVDRCDVIIDFSLAQATDDLLGHLEGTTAALVTGVTGRSEAQQAALTARSAVAPVLEASNFSVGVAVLRRAAALAARMTGPEWDAEIFEIHHRRKQDAPSGTALTLGAEIAAARGLPWPQTAAMGRAGQATGARSAAEIGVAAIRGGDVVGDHTVYLMGPMERLELTHRAHDRRAFAHGALTCARWLAHRSPGRYTLDDVLDDAAKSSR